MNRISSPRIFSEAEVAELNFRERGNIIVERDWGSEAILRYQFLGEEPT